MLAYLVHRGGINGAPAVDQRGPVGLDAAFPGPFGEIRNQARAPVDHGAEHIEHRRLYRRNIRHACSLFLSIRGARANPESRAVTSGFRVRSYHSRPGM